MTSVPWAALLVAAGACVLLTDYASCSSGDIVGDGMTCVDPDGRAGVCVHISTCPSLIGHLRRRDVAYLRRTVCGSGRPLILCCADHQSGLCRRPFVSPRNCGQSSFAAQRVVNGNDVERLGDFPWMALLVYASRPRFQCGGVVINDRWILTAAHCITTNGPSKVRVGDLNIATTTEDSSDHPPQEIEVEKRLRHPDYRKVVVGTERGTFDDIGLLKLRSQIKISRIVKPICLPRSARADAELERSEAFIAGWGVTEYAGETSAIMQWARVNVTRQVDCRDTYAATRYRISSTQVCASGENAGGVVDTCRGDSGGPLMASRSDRNGATTWSAVGVVSRGIGCGSPDFPGVYTRVDRYLEWIGCAVRDY